MRRRRSKSKVEAQRIHAKRRALERHGLELSRRDLDAIVKQIQTRSAAVFVRRESNRVTVWDVSFKDTEIRVVYDSIRHTVVTVLSDNGRASQQPAMAAVSKTDEP